MSKATLCGPGLAVALALGGGEALAQAGLLTGGAVELAPITLSSGQPLTAAPYELEAGKFYELPINADGTAEIALTGPDFFRNVWVNEIVINDIEVRPSASTAWSSTTRAPPRSRSSPSAQAPSRCASQAPPPPPNRPSSTSSR